MGVNKHSTGPHRDPPGPTGPHRASPGPPGTHQTPQRSPTNPSEPSTAGFLNFFIQGPLSKLFKAQKPLSTGRDISRPPQWGSMDPREFGDTPPSLDPPQGGCDGTPIFSIFSIVIFFFLFVFLHPPQWGSFDSPAGGSNTPPVGGCTRRFFRFAPPPPVAISARKGK